MCIKRVNSGYFPAIGRLCFEILRFASFLMAPLTILYDEYIDRWKLTEQKIWVHRSPPPTPLKWVGTKKLFLG